MASYGKFQDNNKKHSTKLSRTTSDPAFNPTVDIVGRGNAMGIERNLKKWADVVSYYRAYPDLWYDLITPETGGIHLDIDQRMILRCLARFPKNYIVANRGYGKTFLELLSKIHRGVFYPNSQLSLTAQTRENSAKLIKEKYEEIIRFYPLLKEEVYAVRFRNDTAELEFHNGSKISNLANNQSTKGTRRHALGMDEDNLTNEEVFLDVLEPVVNVPRRTQGKKGLVDPNELNGSINSWTSAGYKGSSAYYRCLKHLDGMKAHTGSMYFGTSWKLGAYFGRGETVASVLDKKQKNTATSFDMNYNAHWTGATDSALVSAQKLLNCRTLSSAESCWDGKSDYVLGVDIARSMNSANNQTSIAVLKLIRNSNGRVKAIELINLITLTGTLNSTAQTIELKKIKEKYNALAVIVDSNGLGISIVDEALKEQIDPNTGNIYKCWATINTDNMPETQDFDRCLYDLKPQSANSEIISNFIDIIETGKLRLLQKSDNNTLEEDIKFKETVLPSIQTDFLIEEIVNLKLKHLPNGGLSIEKVVKKIDKDRFSSVAYGLWYIKTFLDRAEEINSISDVEYLAKYIQW